METKYYFEQLSQRISAQEIEVECYDINTEELIATINLKYKFDEHSEEWQVESSEFHTNPTIKEIGELIEELTSRASDLFHDFCYQCAMYEDYDEDDYAWFV